MFSRRSAEEEIMDDLSCEGPVVVQTLKELDRINLLLGGNDVSISAIETCMEKFSSREHSVHIADLGCGSGDLLRILSRRAKKKKWNLQLMGIDANPFIIDCAKKNSKAYPEIRFESINIFSSEFRKLKFDIVNCTLFCHHFSDEELVSLLKNLGSQTSTAIIINDIHRHWFAYHSIKWLTAVFSSSAMVKNDAKLSVLRAFRKKELESIIRKAGYFNFSIQWKWAFRFEVIVWIN